MLLRRSAFGWLIEKEWRELLSSRAWWIMLALVGPLTGVSFISAATTYAELSASPVGVGEAFSPLIGIWAPTFSAYELAAAFLFPFVAIRLVAGDRQTGALKIELQRPIAPAARASAKALVLAAAWIVASIPAMLAVLLWSFYGGAIHPPELTTVVAGHMLNAGLTIALGAAAAAVTEHPSTAAIIALGVTTGTWIVNFFAAVQGGFWTTLAGYTPTAMVAQFQHGLVRLDVLLITLTLIGGGLALAAICTRLGVAVHRRSLESLGLAALVIATALTCSLATASWDTSENRHNSFAEEDEERLAHIQGQLEITAHLAPEDPRRSDLESRALSKLRRVLPSVSVEYISATSTGLFEQTDDHYGEIWYHLGGRQSVSRVITEEGVLETIYALADLTPPPEDGRDVFRGHPLPNPPRGAAAVFYGIWPALVFITALGSFRRI